jgi:hypothetical protein
MTDKLTRLFGAESVEKVILFHHLILIHVLKGKKKVPISKSLSHPSFLLFNQQLESALQEERPDLISVRFR